MVDVFNLLNAGTPIVFRTQSGNVVAGEPFGNFKEILALLDPRIVRFGGQIRVLTIPGSQVPRFSVRGFSVLGFSFTLGNLRTCEPENLRT